MMAGAGHLLRPEKAQETGFLGSCDFNELIKHKTSMINYSIVMRSVNANLLEINQAKSRINQAKQEGKNPDQKDLDLVKTEKQNAFAISQYTDVMTIEKFAKHITSHGSVYSRADISAILYMAVDCMREMLLEGKTNVDLNAPIDPDGGDDGNGGSSTTGGGSNAGGSGITGSEGGNKGDTGTSGGNTGEGSGKTDPGSSDGDNTDVTI